MSILYVHRHPSRYLGEKKMKKLISILLGFFPFFAYASGSSLSFTPPTGDFSIYFLGSIFGLVDGVLHGSGSQIMGQMFAVFNAAVLALGGIVIIYTLLVSTMNTANEGQMLGQKWNSMWVPVRATLGLALLIPKASGYCVMQIFVMWVVVQGVGAADKVWDAALNYLNRGGVVVPARTNVMAQLTGSNSKVAQGAAMILAGQTCMLGLQYALTAHREGNLNEYAHNSGSCSGNPDKIKKIFCESPVPDFLSSVNAVSFQENNDPPYILNMPNFESTSDYSFLNGICGQIQWSAVSKDEFAGIQLTDSEVKTATMSRAIAIQQLYLDLSSIAQMAVDNDPQLNQEDKEEKSTTSMSPLARNQYGIPYSADNTPCSSTSNCDKAQTWSTDPSAPSISVIFNGIEFLQAVGDYNAIMQPTLNMINQASTADNYNKLRAFIDQATTQGWIMAGSYFFDLAQLNASATGTTATDTQTGTLSDTTSNLEMSVYSPIPLKSVFSGNDCAGSKFESLCIWLDKKSAAIDNIIGLIDGSSILLTAVPTPDFTTTSLSVQTGTASSTIYGFINNSAMMELPDQPSLKAPRFTFKMSMNKPNAKSINLPLIEFPCGRIMGLCIGETMGDVFYNKIGRVMLNWMINVMIDILDIIIAAILYLPMQAIAAIFKFALLYISDPNINPIVGLANMGVYYINFSTELFLLLVVIITPMLAIPGVDVVVAGIVTVALPMLIAWFGIMLGLGFICAYYIPFVPYMIFTFASIGWLMAVIEAMVAAPIVALGITHPEGEGPFGKGEQAIMILMNVFLRPAMMIIGYIAGIILSYVSVWLINAGFGQVVYFIQGDPNGPTFSVDNQKVTPTNQANNILASSGYTSWAGMYGFFFSVLMYTMLYLIVVQKAFNLISILPDKVLRWIGGQHESYGSDTAQWGEEAKSKVEKAGEQTVTASGQVMKKVGAEALGKMANIKAPKKTDTSVKGDN